MNNAAIDKGVDALVKIDVPASWKDAVDNGEKAVKPGCQSCPSYVENIAKPVNAQAGYDLPVSTSPVSKMVLYLPVLLLMKTWCCSLRSTLDQRKLYPM